MCKRLRQGYAIVLTVTMVLFALGVTASAQDVIRLGAVAPLSSPGSYQQGKELLLGLQWAVDDLNEAGGLLGKQFLTLLKRTCGWGDGTSGVIEHDCKTRCIVS